MNTPTFRGSKPKLRARPRKMMMFFTALSVVISSSMVAAITNDLPNIQPTVDVSAIRMIVCQDPQRPDMNWEGSGALIADDTVLTALHVANGENCRDAATGKPLVMYKSDVSHDMALMTGDQPKIPPIKMSCEPYKKGQTYLAYGISAFMRPDAIVRENIAIGTGRHEDATLSDGTVDKNIAVFHNPIVPGMSGGVYVSLLDGAIHGIVNIGEHDFAGIPTKNSGSYELKGSMMCPKEK
jgi:hypothetical protein